MAKDGAGIGWISPDLEKVMASRETIRETIFGPSEIGLLKLSIKILLMTNS